VADGGGGIAKNTSMPPNCVQQASTIAITLASMPASSARPSAWPPWARMLATVASTLSARRPTTTTRAPSAAKRKALAWPMPVPAPVITARLPSRRPFMGCMASVPSR